MAEEMTNPVQTEYAPDVTGLTFRIDTSRDEKGELTVSASLCNELYVDKEGKVCALPFTIPPSAKQLERSRREQILFEENQPR